MSLNQAAGDGQTQATAPRVAAAGVVGPIEALKDVGQFTGRNALAIIMHGDPHTFAINLLDNDGDFSPFWCMAQGVGQ